MAGADFAALAELLAHLHTAVADSEEVLLYLQQFKEPFLKLLDFKGPNPESRRLVSVVRKVTTPKYGLQELDPVPDVQHALLLSDELRLDEVLCVEYLTSALEQRGVFGAEYAAGLYLEERQLALRCLGALFAEDAAAQHAAQHGGGAGHHAGGGGGGGLHHGGGAGGGGGGGGQRTPHGQAIASFVSELLGEKDAAGRQVLVSRLVAILRDTSLEPRPDSALPVVRDEAGAPVSRALLLQRERRAAARCLLYACSREPHVAPAVAVELLELLAGLLSRMGGTGSGDLFLVEECHLVLLCCAAVLVPHEGPGGSAQQAAMQELAQATRSKAESVSQAGCSAVLRLCWGLLAVASGAAPQDGAHAAAEALRGGALGFLRTVFSHPHLKLDDEAHRHAVAAAVHGLLGQLLRIDVDRMGGSLSAQLLARAEAAVRPTGQPGGHMVLGFAPFAPDSPEARADGLGTLLALLGDALEAFPELYLANLADQEAGARPVKELLDRAINHSVMRTSPEVRVPFLHIMAALASSERGVHLVLRQMEAMGGVPALEVLTLRKLFHTVLHYCLRFYATLSELQRQAAAAMAGGMGAGQAAAAAVESVMNPYEADILVAFLKLLKRVLEHGRPGEVAAFWAASAADLAPQLNGFPLQEPLFQLMCFPVQNTVKAALDEVLGALAAALPDLQPRLLERLLACTVVRPAGAVMTAVPRLDIVQQLAEVEARREEYPETRALLRLLNDLLAPAVAPPGAAGAPPPLPDGGADVAPFTGFVQQNVLGHLWTRGYRVAAQKWELAAAAFTHLQHVLELAGRGPLPPPLPPAEAAASGAKQPPGYAIMHDLLGGGPAFAALLHILLPGYASLTALAGATDEVAPREAAVLAGLRALNAALALDGAFIAALAAGSLANRYQPLHEKLLGGGVRQVAVLLQYVGYPDSADIQVEAIRLALELTARMPNLVDLLAAASGPGADAAAASAGMAYLPAAVAGGAVGAAASAAAAAAAADDAADVLGSLRRGFARAMGAGAAEPDALDNLDAPAQERAGPYGAAAAASSSSHPPDPRAALVLRLLLATSAAPPPGSPPASCAFAHLLLGYDMECAAGGRLDESLLLPRQEYSCLTIVERMLAQHDLRLALTKPKLYSQCLCLLHRLAAAPPGGGGLPMLEYLSPRNNPLIPSLRGLLCLDLPGAEGHHGHHHGHHHGNGNGHAALYGGGMALDEQVYGGGGPREARPHELAAALHSRSWYMRITALLLLRLEHDDSVRQLLAELLAPPSAPALPVDGSGGGAAAAGVAGGSSLLAAMRAATSLRFGAPALSEMRMEQRRMLQDLGGGDTPLEQLLTNPAVMVAAGVALPPSPDPGSSPTEPLFAFGPLFALLRARLDAYAARAGGGAADAAADAARAALRHAQRHNAYVLLAGAQTAAVEAWQQLVQVIFSRQYDSLNALLRGGAAEALYDTLTAACDAVGRALAAADSGGGERVAGPLCSAARVLLAKLQEQSVLHVPLGQAADPLAAVRVPSRCQALLRALADLIAASHARRAPAVRLQLYAALLQYLQLSRGSRLAAGAAPAVLAALLRGWGTPAEAVAVMDQSEELLERANAAVVAEAGPRLVEAIAADALSASAPPLGQAVALHLLRALLSVDAGGPASAAVASAAYSQGLPQQLLAQLASTPPAALTAPGRRARRGVHVAEAALAALAGLAGAGPAGGGGGAGGRAAAAQQLYSLNCVTALNRCSALDLVPEDPASAPLGRAAAGDSVRHRLAALAAPLLRLVLTLLAALPDSAAVRADAAAFAATHQPLLCRLMGEAASAATRGWSPGDSELELADLAVGLLVRLVPSLPSMQPLQAEGLLAMAHKLAFQFCCLDEASSSPIVQALRASRREAAAAAAAGAAAGGGGALLALTNGPSGGVGSGAIVLAANGGGAAAGVGGAAGGAPGSRSAACSRAARVASLRCSLARLLRDTAAAAVAAAHPATAAATANGGAPPTLAAPAASTSAPSRLLRALGPAPTPHLDPLTGRPTLLLVRDMAEQACRDAGEALDELTQLLGLLALPDTGLEEATVTARLVPYAPAGSATVAAAVAAGATPGGLAARRRLARHYWSLAATSLDRQLARSLYVLEAGLSTVALHFLRCLPRPMSSLSSLLAANGGGGGAGAMDTDDLLDRAAANLDLATALPAPTEADARALGSSEELAALLARLRDTCAHAEDLLSRLAEAEGAGGGAGGAGLGLGAGGAGRQWATADPLGVGGGGGGAATAPPVEGIDLMVRALKMYCAR